MDMEIDISNVYDYVSYYYDDEQEVLCVFWDFNNKKLDSFMFEETTCFNYSHNIEKKFSCLWVDELKKRINYNIGDKIPFYVISNPGSFFVFIKNNIDTTFIFEEIGEDGYLYVSPYGDIVYPSLYKCNCLYNDSLDDESHYILK